MNNLYKNYYNQLNNNNNVNGQNINVEVGKESTLIQNNTSNYVGQNINLLKSKDSGPPKEVISS